MADESLIALTAKDYGRLCRLLFDYEKGMLGGNPQPRPPVNVPPVPFFIGKASATITASCDGAFTYWSSTSASTATAPEAVLTTSDNARDWAGTGAASGDKLLIWRHQQSGLLYFMTGIFTSLNSSRVGGYSTTVTNQVLSHSSSGLVWLSPSTCTT